MADTAEQGFQPPDPAERAGVGVGVTPDDASEGEAQVEELAEHDRELENDPGKPESSDEPGPPAH